MSCDVGGSVLAVVAGGLGERRTLANEREVRVGGGRAPAIIAAGRHAGFPFPGRVVIFRCARVALFRAHQRAQDQRKDMP